MTVVVDTCWVWRAMFEVRAEIKPHAALFDSKSTLYIIIRSKPTFV